MKIIIGLTIATDLILVIIIWVLKQNQLPFMVSSNKAGISNLLPHDGVPHGHREQAVDVVGPRTRLDHQEHSHKKTYTQKHLA